MLAGNVVVVDNVNLYIRGDNADNQFEIVVGGEQLEINGLDGTTINGQESYTVAGAKATDSGVSYEGGLRVNLGKGDDALKVTDAQFESWSVIFGSFGDDNIEVTDSHFHDRTIIQTFDGNDSVTTNRSKFDSEFLAITLDGLDNVTTIDTYFGSNSVVATGQHADFIHSQGNHYMGDVNLLLSQKGNDEVQLMNPVVGQNQLGVFLGNHDDMMHGDLSEAIVDGSIRISGQAGADDAGAMAMSDQAAARTTVGSFEKQGLVFESTLGGAANVTEGAVSNKIFNADLFTSQTQYQQYATPVVLETTETIKTVEWSGIYARDYLLPGLPDLGDSFTIEIYEDTGEGVPDDSTVLKFEVGEANRVLAGEISSDDYGNFPIYGYHAEIDFTMEAGKRYWVSIYTELEEAEWVEQNSWEWGLGNTETFDATVTRNGQQFGEYGWSVRWQGEDIPNFAGGEMDLRLRV